MIDPFNDEYFMKQALIEARAAADEGEVPVGAVIVCNNRIIARAHNQTERLNDPTAHAEMLAITAGSRCLRSQVPDRRQPLCDGGTMRDVCRRDRWSQLSKIVYGASDEKRGFQQYAPKALHPKATVKKGILENECAEEMRNFFQRKR